jgi:hypothetical protein
VSAETALRAVLLADAPVNAVVAGRIYPGLLPQAPTTPAIVYQRVTGDHPVNQDGAGGPDRVRVQVDLWAPTFDAVASLRDKVLAALNGKSSVDLQGVFSESEQGTYDDEVKLHRSSMDFYVYESAA